MKLQYYLDKKGNKTYTLNQNAPSGEQTKSAHYKFLKVKDAPKTR